MTRLQFDQTRDWFTSYGTRTSMNGDGDYANSVNKLGNLPQRANTSERTRFETSLVSDNNIDPSFGAWQGTYHSADVRSDAAPYTDTKARAAPCSGIGTDVRSGVAPYTDNTHFRARTGPCIGNNTDARARVGTVFHSTRDARAGAGPALDSSRNAASMSRASISEDIKGSENVFEREIGATSLYILRPDDPINQDGRGSSGFIATPSGSVKRTAVEVSVGPIPAGGVQPVAYQRAFSERPSILRRGESMALASGLKYSGIFQEEPAMPEDRKPQVLYKVIEPHFAQEEPYRGVARAATLRSHARLPPRSDGNAPRSQGNQRSHGNQPRPQGNAPTALSHYAAAPISNQRHRAEPQNRRQVTNRHHKTYHKENYAEKSSISPKLVNNNYISNRDYQGKFLPDTMKIPQHGPQRTSKKNARNTPVERQYQETEATGSSQMKMRRDLREKSRGKSGQGEAVRQRNPNNTNDSADFGVAPTELRQRPSRRNEEVIRKSEAAAGVTKEDIAAESSSNIALVYNVPRYSGSAGDGRSKSSTLPSWALMAKRFVAFEKPETAAKEQKELKKEGTEDDFLEFVGPMHASLRKLTAAIAAEVHWDKSDTSPEGSAFLISSLKPSVRLLRQHNFLFSKSSARHKLLRNHVQYLTRGLVSALEPLVGWQSVKVEEAVQSHKKIKTAETKRELEAATQDLHILTTWLLKQRTYVEDREWRFEHISTNARVDLTAARRALRNMLARSRRMSRQHVAKFRVATIWSMLLALPLGFYMLTVL